MPDHFESSITARDSRQLRRAEAYLYSEPKYALELLARLRNKGLQSKVICQLEAKAYLTLGSHLLALESAAMAYNADKPSAELLAIQLEAGLAVSDHKSVKSLISDALADDSLRQSLQDDIAQSAHLNNQNQLAETLYLELLVDNPNDALYLARLGALKQKQGEMEQAEVYYRRAINCKPQNAVAYNLLANVRRSTTTDNHLKLLQTGLRFCQEPESLALLNYALGKEYEDISEYELAFKHYALGAGQMRETFDYHPSAVSDTFALTQNHFSGSAFKPSNTAVSLAKGGSPAPVFILGMPRTGSTLIDRILSSHKEVVSMGELSSFKAAMKRSIQYSAGEGFHRSFYQLNSESLNYTDIGERYLALATPSPSVAGNIRYFTDKYPLNFMDLGTIARALPRARFIHTVRDPAAILWSNFKQIFTHGMYQHSYDLKECAHYIVQYRQLMAFWHQQFPGRILDVKYEDLVSNTQEEVQKILRFLELPWQQDCLRFHEQKSAVATASVSQVREPVYSRSVSGWQDYQEFLVAGLQQLEVLGVSTVNKDGYVF